MNDEQTNFKVTDRRLFNPDGSPRELSAEEKAEQRPVTGELLNIGVTAEPQSTMQPEAGTSGAANAESEDTELPDADDPASFVNFIMSIASNAASSLGMMEHPVTHQREVDLPLGKQWIDVLGMIEQKTRGNLVAQEAKILESLLADLRMQYVSLVNSTPPKAARGYTGSDITGGR
jgi:hypothetical protein